MVALKVGKIGGSLGLILPKEAVGALRIKEGDTLYLTESDGGYRITPQDPHFEKTMEAMEDIRRRYRNALRELAK